MAQPDIVTQDQAPQTVMIPGLYRRTMATGQHMMVVEIYIERGTTIPMHHHMHEQAGYVASGTVEFTIDGQKYRLHPGDTYAIPGGTDHEAFAEQDTVLIEVFCPPREDFRTAK